MNLRMSVPKAIWIGLLVVNGPVLLLLCGPLFAFDYLQKHGGISRSYNWVGLPLFIAGFVLAWLWWSLSVPRWRLWAYQRVSDIAALKERAIGVGLTWPDNHMFGRTEIKSPAHAAAEKELDPELGDGSDAQQTAAVDSAKKRSD